MSSRIFLWVVLAIQAISATFFISDIVISVLALPIAPVDWVFVELIEVGAAIGLLTGVVLGGIVIRQSRRRTEKAEAALRRAQSAFRTVLEERFVEWELTPAERDVTLFSIKGCSLQEIAELRGVSEGTVKAQTNSIYRKAGVSGRSQLLSMFIDELMED